MPNTKLSTTGGVDEQYFFVAIRKDKKWFKKSTHSFENYNSAHVADYAIDAPIDAGTPYFYGELAGLSLPANTPSSQPYDVYSFKRQVNDTTASSTDIVAGAAGHGEVIWSGTEILDPANVVLSQNLDATTDTGNTLRNAARPSYTARLRVIKDEAASRDRYAVSWHLNGEVIESGITLPKISANLLSDGSPVFTADTAMVTVGASFKYFATNLVPPGDVAFVVMKATIDGAERKDSDWFGRDTV